MPKHHRQYPLSLLLSTTGKLTRLTGAGAKAVAEARQMAAMAPESFMAVMLWRRCWEGLYQPA